MLNNSKFKTVEKKFIFSIVGIVVFCVSALGFALYEANSLRLNSSISDSELNSLVSNDETVVDYLEQEKDFQAHFVTIANLVKQEQQNKTGEVLISVLIPIFLLSLVLGLIVARMLLKPVKESYDSQERFIQDAAHELRNPLAAISASLQSAPKNISDSNFYRTVKRQTNRLVNINEDLLFLEKRKVGERIQEIDISSLTQDVLEDMQTEININKIKVKAKIQPDIVKKIDQLDYVRLSKNLISNAIKYSNKGGSVFVELKQENNKTVLKVRDKGIGIPESELANIGDRFYRAKNVGDTQGTGLGMSIVQKVANSYGGKIDIQSSEGVGTEVEVRF